MVLALARARRWFRFPAKLQADRGECWRKRMIKRILGLGLVVGLLLLTLTGCSLFQQGPDIKNWQPSPSPKSETVIFADKVDDNFELIEMDVESGDREQLTSSDDDKWAPDYNVDGDKIVFVSNRDDNTDIYLLDKSNGEQQRLTSASGQDVNPRWTSEGRILFNSDRSGNWEIYSMDADGSNLQQLTSSSENEDEEAQE